MAHCSQVPVGCDVVSLDDLAGLWVLMSREQSVSPMTRLNEVTLRRQRCRRRSKAPSYLVMPRPYKGIVAQVSANVGRDDLTVNAIAGNEVLVLSSCGRRPGLALIAGLPRHGGDGEAEGFAAEKEGEKRPETTTGQRRDVYKRVRRGGEEARRQQRRATGEG